LDQHEWHSKRRETSTLGRMGENSQAILLARSYPLLIKRGTRLNPELRASNDTAAPWGFREQKG
jgi:hypothetical protein